MTPYDRFIRTSEENDEFSVDNETNTDDESVEAPSTFISYVGTATTKLNIRSEPDTSENTNIILEVLGGTQLTIIEELIDWYNVEINGTVGWAMKSFIDV